MVEPDDTLTPEDLSLAATLQARRPSPTLSFRGTLSRRIAQLDPGYGPRPAHLWVRAGALAAGGGVLVVLGLLVSLGAI